MDRLESARRGFMTEDEARNYFASAMAETVAAMPAVAHTLGPNETEQLRAQLKTRDAEIAELRDTARDWQRQFHSAEADAERYRTALEGMKWNTDPIIRAHVLKALAKRDAEQEGGKNG